MKTIQIQSAGGLKPCLVAREVFPQLAFCIFSFLAMVPPFCCDVMVMWSNTRWSWVLRSDLFFPNSASRVFCIFPFLAMAPQPWCQRQVPEKQEPWNWIWQNRNKSGIPTTCPQRSKASKQSNASRAHKYFSGYVQLPQVALNLIRVRLKHWNFMEVINSV